MEPKLQTLIELIRDNILSGRYSNEQSVREAIVAPILRNLEWDDLDPLAVIREYNLEGRRVDYALATNHERPIAIIEVKAPGNLEGADRQLFEYAFHEGVPFAILTDGRQWHFFLPGEQGNYSERRVYRLDLVDRKPSHAAKIFERYLSYERLASGQALRDARRDYRGAARRRDAEQILPKAWGEIVIERDELLLDLIAERAESLCGTRPEAEQVENFVAQNLEQTLASDNVGKSDSAISQRKKSPEHRSGLKATEPQRFEKRTKVSSSRKISYELFSKKREASSAKEALLEIVRELSGDDPNFFEKLSRRVKARTRNHVAKSKQEVYPERRDLAADAVQIIPGWYIGLNIANREKLRIIKQACDVAGIQFGKDLKIDLPNS